MLLPLTLIVLSAGASGGAPFEYNAHGSPMATSIQAPTEAELLGMWRGTTGAHRKRILTFSPRGQCALDGVAGTWSFEGPGRLRVRAGSESFLAECERRGTGLTLKIAGKRSRFRLKEGGAQEGFQDMTGFDGGPAGPVPDSDPNAPFPGAPKAIDISSWQGLYHGDGYEMLIGTTGPAGPSGAFHGELVRGLHRWPFTLIPSTTGAVGCIGAAGGSIPFDLTMGGGGLTFRCGAQRFVFEASGMTVVQPSPGAKPTPAPRLKGVGRSPAQTYKDPDGYFSFDMPKRWSAQATEAGLVINPGFEATDTVDAVIIVNTGRLEARDLHRAPTAIIDRDERDLRQGYSAEGIRLRAPSGPSRSVRIGSYPGAVQEWKGTLDDGTEVDVWLGAASGKGHYVSVLAILTRGRENDFLPDVKRILSTMEVNPPDRRPDLEQQLAGRRVSNTSTNESGFFGTIYDFGPDGTVHSKSLFSGGVGLGSVNGQTTDAGTYAIVGTTLYMTFPETESSFDLVLQGKRIVAVNIGGSAKALE